MYLVLIRLWVWEPVYIFVKEKNYINKLKEELANVYDFDIYDILEKYNAVAIDIDVGEQLRTLIWKEEKLEFINLYHN